MNGVHACGVRENMQDGMHASAGTLTSILA
jgi:hypothetical protein